MNYLIQPNPQFYRLSLAAGFNYHVNMCQRHGLQYHCAGNSFSCVFDWLEQSNHGDAALYLSPRSLWVDPLHNPLDLLTDAPIAAVRMPSLDYDPNVLIIRNCLASIAFFEEWQRVNAMSPLEAFRQGYGMGYTEQFSCTVDRLLKDAFQTLPSRFNDTKQDSATVIRRFEIPHDHCVARGIRMVISQLKNAGS